MKGDCRSQQAAGSGNLQPCSLPYIRKTAADNGSTDHVHGSGPNTTEENKRKMSGSVLDQVADVLKCGKGKGYNYSGIFDLLSFRLKYQQIKEQWQFFMGSDFNARVEIRYIKPGNSYFSRFYNLFILISEQCDFMSPSFITFFFYISRSVNFITLRKKTYFFVLNFFIAEYGL